MKDNSGSSSSAGIGLPGVLLVVFVVLKLTGHIDWAWWIVLYPLWAGLALTILVMLVLGAIAALAGK